MKTKKLLSLLLALVMAFSFTFSVIAEPVMSLMYITSVFVHIDVPVYGQTPDFTPEFGRETFGCEFITVGNQFAVNWYNLTDNVDMTENDVFEENKVYCAYFLIGAQTNYEFKKASEMFAFVNGEQLENSAIGGIYGEDEAKKIAITAEMTPVYEYDINITNGYAMDASGAVITKAEPGSIVTIVAKDPLELRDFNWWRFLGNGSVEFADDEAETTTFVMPQYPVEIEAFYSNILVESAEFSIGGYFIDNTLEDITASASEGIEILPLDGVEYECALFLDNNGRPSTDLYEGRISANYIYWVGIRFRAAEGYDICELMEENVNLRGAVDKILGFSYENEECAVFFKLPKAIENKNIITDVEVLDVTVPVANATPDFEPLIPENAKYSLYEIVWKRLENTETTSGYTVLNRDDVFKMGYDYQIDVVLQANENYSFEVSNNNEPIVSANLNGEPAMCGTAYDNESAKEFIVVSYVYTVDIVVEDYVTVTVETWGKLENYEDIEIFFVYTADSSIAYTFKTTLKTTEDGKTTLDDGKTTLDDGKTTLDDGKTTLDDGKTTLDDGKTTLDDGKTTLDDGKTTLDDGKTTLDNGKTTLDFYLKTTDGFLKTTDIPEGEYIIKTTKPGFVSKEFKTTLKTTEPANLKTTLHIIGDADDNGKIDADDYINTKRVFFGMKKFDDLQILRADLNNSKTTDADDYIMLKRVYFGVLKTTDLGKTTLEDFKTTLKTTEDGKILFDDGKTTLDDGKTTLDDGKTTLDDGKTTLDDGKTTLDEGKTTLDTGKTTLDDGKTTLDTGKTTLDINK